jgi:hypothetical protein
MKEWFSTKELTYVNGIPNTIKGILLRANTECWQVRDRKSSGGGNEFHIDSLPADAKKALRISEAKKSASFNKAQAAADGMLDKEQAIKDKRVNDEESHRAFMALSGKAEKRVEAKAFLLSSLKEFQQVSHMAGRNGMVAFVEACSNGQIELPEFVASTIKKITVSSLYNWLKSERENGTAALAGNYGKHRKGTGVIDSQPELHEYAVGMLVAFPDIKPANLYKALKAEFNGRLTLPSLRTLQRWIVSWIGKNKQVYTAIISPDEWKNKYMCAVGDASERATGLNSLWEFDATPADVMLTDGRHSITGVIDVNPRRFKLLVTPTATSKSVTRVIREAILEWGVPEIVKTDNGSDYKSQHVRKVFERLGIKQEFCLPFHGWQKPHIERAFRTFSHDIAELLKGFIGHNISERQQIESRKSFSDRLFEKDSVIDVELSSEQLQTFCNDWIEHVYHHNVHDKLKCTPHEMVRNSTKPISVIQDERLLDVLLSEPAGLRTVGKKGIKLDNNFYIHPELFASMGEVQVYYDESDMGNIYVYDLDGNFICQAEDPSITGVSREEVAAKSKKVQREAVQEVRRELKKSANKVTKRDVAQQIIEHRKQENIKQNTLEFPKQIITHESKGIDAAMDALSTQAAIEDHYNKPAEDTAKQLAEIIKLQQPIKEESHEDRYRKWHELDERARNGEELQGQESVFYRTLPETAEFKTFENLTKMGMFELHG